MGLMDDLSGSELLEATIIYHNYFAGKPFTVPKNMQSFVKKMKTKYPSTVICPPLSSTLRTTTPDENTKVSSSPMLLRL
jgi:hypothetical protein